MHHVGITLDDHFLGELHRADFRYATGVVTTEVDQHQVFSDFLVVRQQVFFQRQVCLFIGSPRTGAGNRAHGDQVVFDPHQYFRRTANDVEVAEVEEVHVRRRVEAA
ncbi:hypothetical protein D9M69_483360 [compost metagenome]